MTYVISNQFFAHFLAKIASRIGDNFYIFVTEGMLCKHIF